MNWKRVLICAAFIFWPLSGLATAEDRCLISFGDIRNGPRKAGEVCERIYSALMRTGKVTDDISLFMGKRALPLVIMPYVEKDGTISITWMVFQGNSRQQCDLYLAKEIIQDGSDDEVDRVVDMSLQFGSALKVLRQQ